MFNSMYTMTKELKPIYNHQRSFYKKAYIYRDSLDNRFYLISYDTIVASIDRNAELHRHWWGCSRTTMNHVREFCKQLIHRDYFITAQEWRELPVE